MSQTRSRIAVAIVHGIGQQGSNFADPLCSRLQDFLRPVCGGDVVFQSVYWSPIIKRRERELFQRVRRGGPLSFSLARGFLISYLGDAIAYQITPSDRRAYDLIHEVFADALRALADEAGPDAPLCVIAHSLGSIIASNYLYDLQEEFHRPIVPDSVRARMGDTPLERGETLSLFYTLGSPLALWSLRYPDFGRPVEVPSPRLARYHPDLDGEWVNFYDKDDVVATPLKPLNDDYGRVVKEDRPLNVGTWLTRWNPFSHLSYWTNPALIERVAAGLIRTWKIANAYSGR